MHGLGRLRARVAVQHDGDDTRLPPICRCDANAAGTCTNTTANDCPTSGTTCRPVTNNTIYGVCL